MDKKRRITAEERMTAFIEAVATEKFGKVPSPPTDMEPINRCIDSFVYQTNDGKAWLDGGKGTMAYGLSNEEIRYCWMVAERLGFIPKWEE